MGYKIDIVPSAIKELGKLDRQAQRRIAQFIDGLTEMDNPRQAGIAMQGASHLWRYRIGDYRLIAEIHDNIVTIRILRVGHRREIYR